MTRSTFVGDIPHNYEKFLGPMIFAEYAKDLAKRIRAPKEGIILEIASGTGLASRQIRNIISQKTKIIVTDLSEDMLDISRGKFRDSENIEFKVADALDLPFQNGAFDAIACQFSLMFFPDKLTALQEIARTLKPGGRFYFNIWDSLEFNHLIQTVNETIIKCFPGNHPRFFDIPYGYYEIDQIKRLLFLSGFSDVDISILPRLSTADKARDVALGYILGTPVISEIESLNSKPIPKVLEAVEKSISQKFGNRSITAKMQAIVFSALYPGK